MKLTQILKEDVDYSNVQTNFEYGGIHYDNKDGLGATGYNTNVLYRGFGAIIPAKDFIELAASADRSDSAYQFADKIIDENVAIACPFLKFDIEYSNEDEETSIERVRIRGHEGRGRVEAIKLLAQGYRKEDHNRKFSSDIVVHFVGAGEIRSRHLGEEFFDVITKSVIFSENKKIVTPTFKKIFHDKDHR